MIADADIDEDEDDSEGTEGSLRKASIDRPPSVYLKDGGGTELMRENTLTIASQRGTTTFPDTVYGAATTQTRLESETADQILWARYANANTASNPNANADTLDASTRTALSRITFTTTHTPHILHAVIRAISRLSLPDASSSPQNHGKGKLVVVAGRSRRMAVESHAEEMKVLEGEYRAAGGGGAVNGEVRKTVGDVVGAVMLAGVARRASLVVMQAGLESEV